MTPIDEFFARRKKVMLQFSSGKDSAAVLWLLEPYWDKVDVVWGNAGNPYPETLAYMHKIEKLVPRFFSVLGQQQRDIAHCGWPVEAVPLGNTAKGNALSGEAKILFRPFWECCESNLWKPVEEAVIAGGYDGVIRGQKSSDKLKNPMQSGTILNGVEYFYPINDWTDKDVFEYLGEEKLPESYKRGMLTSLDCMTCTAYTRGNPGRLNDLRKIDIDAWKRTAVAHLALADALQEQKTWLENCYAERIL